MTLAGPPLPTLSDALSGTLVLDLSRLYPGPFATQILADMGARVVKVEEPAGDPARRIGPFVEGDGFVFEWANRGKESVALNLKDGRGLEVFERLASKARVLVESFRPGTLARLGLGPDVLLRRNPHLVVVSLSAYGATGPLGGEPGHDINAQALAGIVALTGPSPRPPPVQSADVAAALYVVVAVLAALRKPEGGWLDLSMADAALSLNGLAVAAAHAGAPPRADSTVLHGGFPGYAVYPAKDGRFLALGVLEPAHWTDLVGRLGLGAEATREDFARRLLERSLPEWMIALRGLPVCEAVSPADAASEPQFRARGARGRPADPLGLPSLRPAPRLGAHTGPVLSELGYDAEAVRRLSGAGVVRLGNP